MSKKSINTVLLVEDNPGDARLLREMFNEQGAHDTKLTLVESMSEAEKHLAERAFDIILLDPGLPDVQGLAAVRRAHAAAPHVPLVVLTGLDDESVAVQALQEGAQDYLVKGQIETRGLLRALRYAIERKAAEKHLVQMEGRYRGLLEAAPDAMVVVNPGGEIVLLNVQAEKQFGYRRDELLGQKVTNIIPEGFAERLLADDLRSADEALAQQIGTGIELTARRKDGSEFPIELMLSPLESVEGILVTAAIRDISVRKRMEGLKDEFIATVSHELRTPLTSISGSLGLLMGNATGKLPDPMARLLTIAHTNSQRLVRLVNDILDIERMEAGQAAFNFRRVEIRSLVEQTIEANRGFAEAYGVQIRFEDESTVGDVRADSDRLAQAVTNLLSNAIKFSSRGREVMVAIEQETEFVRISVRDHGPGISVDFKPRIFERFAQADATDARQKGGTGLGLSIVKQIVDRLGGEVGFADAPGGGTIFHIVLPCWKDEAGAEIDPEAQLATLKRISREYAPQTAAPQSEPVPRSARALN